MTEVTSLTDNLAPRICRVIDGGLASERASHRGFVAVCVLVFIVSAALTIVWCGSMSGMREMLMPGGRRMSMVWMRMPGQTWFEAAASFLGMWLVMMMAMMLPSLAPILWRYRQVIGSSAEAHMGLLTTLVGVGYFFVWTLLGIAVYPLGVAVAAGEMRQPVLARVAPIAMGVVVLIAGALQFTSLKAHHLGGSRKVLGCGRALPADTGTALRFGLRLGLHCSYCCAGFTAVLLAIGVMDLRTMALVTAGITAERVVPAGEHVARAIGWVVVAAGLLLILRAAGIA
ncbi:MAG TPA: DUF2182 domain-containing protein [Bryobacteraceae bacterium]|nr:DUF2182 domain-containing protein [Bryobacteraceae bacterium]